VAEIVMLRDYDTDGEGLAWALAGGCLAQRAERNQRGNRPVS
jgi:hypothetical protein